MADLAQLEKMSRELKCPICLSLVKSAVSLPCNHVFCNSCIMETMKSTSDCPVCKLPFRRREVRPSPHMDNLASIFKSMEASAGVNILTTQVATTVKHHDGKTDENHNKNPAETKTTIACIGKPKKGIKRSKKEKINSNADKSEAGIVPTFPAKKRIRVTPIPTAETPLRAEKLESNKVLGIERTMDNAENENPVLSPFFWLRDPEEDDDSLEEQSIQQTAERSSSPNFPCFSDIKDSDDETPAKSTPTSKSHVSLDMDSEIFEWTQRACSPELSATPVKSQTIGRFRQNAIQHKGGVGTNDMESLKGDASNDIPRSTRVINGRKTNPTKKKKLVCKTNKRHLEASDSLANDGSSERVLPEFPSIPDAMHSKSSLKNGKTEDNRFGNSMESKKESEKIDSCRTGNLKRKMKKIKGIGSNKVSDLQHVAAPIWQEDQIQSDSYRTAPTSNSYDREMGKSGSESNIVKYEQKKRVRMSKYDPPHKMIEGIPADYGKKESVSKECEQTCIAVITSSNQSSEAVQSKIHDMQKQPGVKKMNTVEISDNGIKRISCSTPKNAPENMSADFCQESLGAASKGFIKINKLPVTSKDMILKTCRNVPRICCAFCHSGDVTEVSGEMMHYFDGKPVAVDYNRGAKVIHVHKHCLEWAPNVYFEDDVVINLLPELARSKRIRCCCCGVRGAALGCFEKSCGKSFHFTCAKLIKECRWDEEHFVMLCPLHMSSNLQNEIPAPQRKRKKINTKGEVQVSVIGKPVEEKGQSWRWRSGTPCKWIICCSALNVAEQEIINEFTRLTGVHLSKKWSPAVTHIIASTDENGACRRTFKFLMGITKGQWILSILWIKECLKVMEPVDEEKYEIGIDVHGVTGGPRLGRLRVMKKQPKLFNGYQFYFSGDFEASYKGYLQELVTAAGGTILHRKPISRDHKFLNDSSTTTTFIIYNVESPDKHSVYQAKTILKSRKVEAEALAKACCVNIATNSWVVDTIAACKLQPLAKI